MPKLKIIASEEANADNTYQQPNAHAGERWKFFRVLVKNKPFIQPFRWIPRQTAENCRAKIEFSKIGTENFGFSMSGRWVSTPEIPHIPNDAILKLLYPDPVTIPVDEKEFLDVRSLNTKKTKKLTGGTMRHISMIGERQITNLKEENI